MDASHCSPTRGLTAIGLAMQRTATDYDLTDRLSRFLREADGHRLTRRDPEPELVQASPRREGTVLTREYDAARASAGTASWSAGGK